MKKTSLLVMAAILNAAAMAQETGGNVDVNLNADPGGSNMWMWIIGAVVLIVLLVALLGRGGTTRTTRTTIIKD